MKIPTLLFTILLLNLTTICVCTNVRGEEGNIPSAENVYPPPPNDDKLEGGEANGIPATVNNENDFDDGFDINSEDFKEIMATPLAQELIHSNAPDSMIPFSSDGNLPKSATNVGLQSQPTKRKTPIAGVKRTSKYVIDDMPWLMQNRRENDNKIRNMYRVPEFRKNVERFMREKKNDQQKQQFELVKRHHNSQGIQDSHPLISGTNFGSLSQDFNKHITRDNKKFGPKKTVGISASSLNTEPKELFILGSKRKTEARGNTVFSRSNSMLQLAKKQKL